MLSFRTAVASDAPELASRLRAADQLEIQAAVGLDPAKVLAEGIEASTPCCAVLDETGTLLALFGVVPDPGIPRSGMVWLLGTDGLATNGRAVLRHSRQWVATLHSDYDRLWNYIDARNEAHIAWLRWCGFQLLERSERHGVERRPFWRFERIHTTSADGQMGKTLFHSGDRPPH